MHRRVLSWFVILVVCGTAVPVLADDVAELAQPSTGAATEAGDEVLARVANREIRRSDVEALLAMFGPEARSLYPPDGDLSAVIQEMASRSRLAREAELLGLADLPEVAAELRAARTSTLVNAYIDRVVVPGVIDDAAIAAAFEADPSPWVRPLSVRVHQVIVTSEGAGRQVNRLGDDAATPELARRKIDFLARRLAEGVSFEELAADFSEDASSARGGDRGWLVVDQLAEPLAQALRDAPVGHVTDVVEVPGAFVISRVDGRREAGIPPFEDVRDQVRESLVEGKQREIYEALRLESVQLERKFPLELPPTGEETP